MLTVGRHIRFNDGLRRELITLSMGLHAPCQWALAQRADCQLDHQWVADALRLLWLLRVFIRNYERRNGAQPHGKFAPLYDLKHDLLALLCVLPGPDCYSWQVGRATHLPGSLSLLFEHTHDQLPHLHVLWPLRHVPMPVAVVIAERCGGWPPPEVLALPPWEL
ncbi:MAG: hypothetical protein HY565_01105 [Candidatus Kerfeldbacteria bacterium]|nr:hypothetical protein [Candidatus Kerfeldbacteria bacterium]